MATGVCLLMVWMNSRLPTTDTPSLRLRGALPTMSLGSVRLEWDVVLSTRSKILLKSFPNWFNRSRGLELENQRLSSPCPWKRLWRRMSGVQEDDFQSLRGFVLQLSFPSNVWSLMYELLIETWRWSCHLKQIVLTPSLVVYSFPFHFPLKCDFIQLFLNL